MNIDAVELVEFYEKWLAELQGKPLSVVAIDAFNAEIQRAITTPYRDAAVKTELAQLKLKANKFFYNKKRSLE